MAPPFLVVSVPSDNDTKTNQVYLNSADYRSNVGSNGAVLISGYPFSVKAHDKVAPGTIAMNSVQRRLINLSTAAGSTVTLQHLDSDQPDIAQITFTVEYVLSSKKGGTLDCQEFAHYVKTQFFGQCFRASQQLAVVLDASMRLIATVTALTLSSSSSLSSKPSAGAAARGAEMGYLTATTSVIVLSSEKSMISLTNVSDNQLDAQQTQLVNNFNLESLGIGGLHTEFAQVFRRAFASRMFPASYVKKLGIKHVKGVLLYGPPGTGKTLIARKIGEILNCHEPKVVNGPEVFNKFVGGTEENVRKLFVDAEAEQAAKGDQSRLHLIIFDEFDAICKQRGAVRDSTGVSDNVVNQLLSKIDGVNALNNVLLIGMTNRLDLIDEAILRPGRFEVHVEIGLPNESGRVEIFRIHTAGMRANHIMASDVQLEELAATTKNYSGAEIEGVVRAATSNAFNRHIDLDNPTQVTSASTLKVTRRDFVDAIAEVVPAFGQAKQECANLKRGGIFNYGHAWNVLQARCHRYVEQLTNNTKRIHVLSVLIDGLPGCGKSAIAAYLAEYAAFPYVKVVTSDDMVGYGEMQRVNILRKAFEDAYKSSASCLILDDLERLIDFSQLGGRYSNALLQALLVLIKRPPPEGKKLLIIGSTAQYAIMESLELAACFAVRLSIAPISSDAIPLIAGELGVRFASEQDMHRAMQRVPHALPIKHLLLLLEMAAEQGPDGKTLVISEDSLEQALDSAGIV